MTPIVSDPELAHTLELARCLMTIPVKGDHSLPRWINGSGCELLAEDFHRAPHGNFRSKDRSHVIRAVVTRDHDPTRRAQLIRRDQDYILMIGPTRSRSEKTMNTWLVLGAVPPKLEPFEPFYERVRERIRHDMQTMTSQQRERVKLTLYGHSMGGWIAAGISQGDFDVDLPDGAKHRVPERILALESPGMSRMLLWMRTPKELASLEKRLTEIVAVKDLGFAHGLPTRPVAAGGGHLAHTIVLLNVNPEFQEALARNPKIMGMKRQLDFGHERRHLLSALERGDMRVCTAEDLLREGGFNNVVGWGIRAGTAYLGSKLKRSEHPELEMSQDTSGVLHKR